MPEDHRWEGEQALSSPLRRRSASGEELAGSDFDNSLLQEIAQSGTPLPTPRLKTRLGGPEGRRFEILEELGSGTMGQVFRAWDEQLQRTVALKFLTPRHWQDASAFLLREARAIARLDHENIVRIHDVAEWRENAWAPRVPFLVMECLEGESLSALMKRGRLGLRRAVELMYAVAAGLAHAHAHHVVHRDLKSSNVFITRQGQVKLLDFGLAHLLAESSEIPHLPTAGTPLYMAPEQWQGGRQDDRTDVWAAGVLFHELLTGAPPYVFDTPQDLREQILSPKPILPVREKFPEVPEDVARLVEAMLDKEPSHRPPPAELRERLKRLVDGFGLSRETPRHLAPERRQVTLLVCRLAGLAELAECLSTEDASELESAFHRLASRFIQQQGGLAALFMGDEVLACFGYPLAREEDAERAVRAGMKLAQELTSVLRQEWPGKPLGAVAVQVGLHTDSVVFDDLQPELRGHTLSMQGKAPQLASALARRAEPGTVVLSGTTWSLVPGAFEAEAREPLSGGGLAQPVQTWRVMGARRAALRFERSWATRGITPLVGREPELQRLQSFWEWTRQGRGLCVLLEGEAGIGKSRLMLEWSGHLQSEQDLVLRAQCWMQSQASALAPILETMRNLLRLGPEASPEQNLRWVERRMALRGLTPKQTQQVASLLSLPVAQESSHLLLPAQRQKEESFQALAELLWHVASEGPVLFVVEDLHWADPSTLEFIGFLLERLVSHPMMILLSVRPHFRIAWPVHPWLHRMTLERLAPEQTAELVRKTAGNRALPEETVRQLVARTDGIPLFIEEMARRVLESAPGAETPIPATLRELLLARLDALPPAQKALVHLCAVVGRSFSHALLSALTEQDETMLRGQLRGLLEMGLLDPLEDAAVPSYQFRHALIQEAAWDSQLRGTRRQHHQRIAQILAERFPEVAEASPERLAWHHTQAGDTEPARNLWARAGALALRRSANLEAISHFKQALELLQALPESPSRRGEELKLLFALGIPLMQSQGFASPELERTYVRALALFLEAMDAPGRVVLPDWSWGSYAYLFARARFQEASKVGQKLVEVGRRQDNREVLALGHRMLATIAFTGGDMPKALRHVQEALASSNFSLEQQRVLAVRHWVNPRAYVLAYASVVHSALGHPALAERHGREALALAHKIGHPHTLAYVLTYVAFGGQFRLDLRQTVECSEECVALSRENHFLLWEMWSAVNRSWALVRLGHREEHQVLRSHLEQWQAMGMRAGMPVFHWMLGDTCLMKGESEETLVQTQKGLEWARATGERSYEAELYRLQGEGLRAMRQEAAAQHCFLRALTVARQQHAGTFEVRSTTSLCRQLRDQGKWKAARQKLSRVCDRFDAGLDSADMREARTLLAQLWEQPH
ncbi:protein kinase [Stigmatella sp. ncwal1]|uniref:Protein kinase n=1 Tax=Stigmatella ashevillensis TaxID=2995309 RepID=A0ABT5D8T5_9BACT|nr:protein kinase [Stigmatella ashevillena]MDC0709475.1 protein kinase [Stigmatella ashevillena]